MLFLFAVNVKTLTAQEWLIFKIYETDDLHSKLPFFDDYFFSEIAYAKETKTTSSFHLKGNVKSVEMTLVQDSLAGDVPEKHFWEFDTHKQLITYCKGDSINYNDWIIEHYQYDANGNLLNRQLAAEQYGNFEYSWYTYNTDGYLLERIDSFSSFDVMYYSKAIFKYNIDYTQLDLEYEPLSDELFWNFDNAHYTISYDYMGRYESPGRNVDYDKYQRPVGYFINNGCGSNSALCLQVNTKYDERGNVIEQTVHDMTTRNSLWSFSSHFKAEYNEQNLVIRREEFPVGEGFASLNLFATNNSNEITKSEVKSVVYTFDYVFDEKGNWITKTIFMNGALQSSYQREIIYY